MRDQGMKIEDRKFETRIIPPAAMLQNPQAVWEPRSVRNPLNEPDI